jgi:hypothetical protein
MGRIDPNIDPLILETVITITTSTDIVILRLLRIVRTHGKPLGPSPTSSIKALPNLLSSILVS